MMNEQLIGYVMSERARGVADDTIRGALLAQGWKTEDIDVAIRGGISSGAGVRSGMFSGRLGKKKYLHIFLIGIALGMILTALGIFIILGFIGLFSAAHTLSSSLATMFTIFVPIALVSACYSILHVSATTRRLHDVGHSGWWAVLLLISPINLIMVIYLCIKNATTDGDKYGPEADPNVSLLRAMRGS